MQIDIALQQDSDGLYYGILDEDGIFGKDGGRTYMMTKDVFIDVFTPKFNNKNIPITIQHDNGLQVGNVVKSFFNTTDYQTDNGSTLKKYVTYTKFFLDNNKLPKDSQYKFNGLSSEYKVIKKQKNVLYNGVIVDLIEDIEPIAVSLVVKGNKDVSNGSIVKNSSYIKMNEPKKDIIENEGGDINAKIDALITSINEMKEQMKTPVVENSDSASKTELLDNKEKDNNVIANEDESSVASMLKEILSLLKSKNEIVENEGDNDNDVVKNSAREVDNKHSSIKENMGKLGSPVSKAQFGNSKFYNI